MQSPVLSIVIGVQDAESTVEACLKALLSQRHEQAVEILVVDGSFDSSVKTLLQQFSGTVLVQGQPTDLIPQLWGVGILAATAPLVALLSAHCIPGEDWIANILETASAQPKFVGFGGAIAPPNCNSRCDWAVYFCRYSAFMPPVERGEIAEIAGDNAIYRKVALDRYWPQPETGFWETLFHHALRSQGEQLYLSDHLEVRLGAAKDAAGFFKARFRHGYHYGSTRPQTSFLGRLVRVLASPVLLPFLASRIALRVAQHRPDWLWQYLIALPWLLFFLTAWSLGEMSGYLRPKTVRA